MRIGSSSYITSAQRLKKIIKTNSKVVEELAVTTVVEQISYRQYYYQIRKDENKE